MATSFDSSVHTTSPSHTRDGLGIAALVLGVAGFLPIPGVLGSILAIVLGWLSGTPTHDGVRRRTSAGTTGLILGIVGVTLFATICFIYFVVLGYPLPRIHRYRPSA